MLLKSFVSALAMMSAVAFAAGSEEPAADMPPAKKEAPSKDLIDAKGSETATAVAEIQALADAGKFAEAEAAAHKAIAKTKDDAKLFNLLGFSLRNQNKNQQAIAAYRTALKLQPDFAQAKEYLAVAYLKTKRTKEAKALHDELKVSHPDLAAMIEAEAKKAKVKW